MGIQEVLHAHACSLFWNQRHGRQVVVETVPAEDQTFLFGERFPVERRHPVAAVVHSLHRECISDKQLSFLIPVKGNNIPELIQIVLEFNYCTHITFETSFWIIPYFCPPVRACPYLFGKVFGLYGVTEKKYPLPKETAFACK